MGTPKAASVQQRPKERHEVKAKRFHVVKLELRIAPKLAVNHNETTVREPAKVPKDRSRKPRLQIVKLEERIAPKLATNHNETLVGSGR
jgi:hypothetical protein